MFECKKTFQKKLHYFLLLQRLYILPVLQYEENKKFQNAKTETEIHSVYYSKNIWKFGHCFFFKNFIATKHL